MPGIKRASLRVLKVKLKCAALQVMGGTQSNNGTDSTLVTNSAVGTGAVSTNDIVGFGVNTAAHNGLYSIFMK